MRKERGVRGVRQFTLAPCISYRLHRHISSHYIWMYEMKKGIKIKSQMRTHLEILVKPHALKEKSDNRLSRRRLASYDPRLERNVHGIFTSSRRGCKGDSSRLPTRSAKIISVDFLRVGQVVDLFPKETVESGVEVFRSKDHVTDHLLLRLQHVKTQAVRDRPLKTRHRNVD